MLVARYRSHSLALNRSFDPVPAAVAMLPQAPGVSLTGIVAGSPAKADHHTRGTSARTQGSRMVHPYLRSVTAAVQLDPREGSLLDAEAPNIVDRLLPGVSTEDK